MEPIDITIDKNEFLPGERLEIDGIAILENGEEVDGTAVIDFGKEFTTDVSDSKFNLRLILNEDIKSGSHDVIISVADINVKQTQAAVRYYTGLQVARDPGVWVVYSGFIFMILGCYITFFMSHRQICVDVNATEDKYRIMVAGTANKNKLANERKVKKIAHILINDEG